MAFFQYGDEEVAYLKGKDKLLGAVIEKIGHVERKVTPDLFGALVSSIVEQQISAKAGQTIWKRLCDGLGEVTPERIGVSSLEELQSFGITYKKAGYIKKAAEKVLIGELNLVALTDMADEDVCRVLSTLAGVGVWTAEMLMIFSMERPDVLSFGDLAIHRGLRMVYHHRKIDKKLFEKYRRRYAPCGTVASFYLWAVAAGNIAGMKDYAPKKKQGR